MSIVNEGARGAAGSEADSGNVRMLRRSRPKRVAVFVSKEAHCLEALIDARREGVLDGELAVVVGNHRDCEELAASWGIPFVHVPVPAGGKAEAERAQLEALREHRVDMVALARYMQVLSADFIESFGGRIINVHHALLPAFQGARPYHQAFERGVKVIGATSHYVTAELDQGPIIEQEAIRVDEFDTVEDFIEKGRALEAGVLVSAVAWELSGRIELRGGKCLVHGLSSKEAPGRAEEEGEAIVAEPARSSPWRGGPRR